MLGPQLSVHDAHGYSTWDTLNSTASVLKGRTVVGLYFSADWCPPCQAFNPLLKQLHSSKRANCNGITRTLPPFEVVLVSRCRDRAATEQYFAGLPWAAMTHAEASGKRGRELRNKFHITTIPALVLLDGEGALLCGKAHDMLRDDPTGKYFLWQGPTAAPRIP
jgi:nucleoredoxin